MLLAGDINVSNRSEFLAALKVVTPGDTIKFAPGIYSQGTSSDFAWVSNVHGKANAYITITAQDPNNPPVFRDNKVGLVISDSSYIRVSNLKFDSNVDIGLYIKGSRVSSDTLSPNHHIIAENVTILNTGLGGAGNNDAMKIGATDYFTVQNVHIEGWGRGGGSAMDVVSSQYGLIQDSRFVHVNRSTTGSDQGVTMKGGSRDILVQNNFFHHAGDIAISIGQDTGLSFFRDPIGSVLADGSRFNYEAKDIEVAGNIFVGGVRAPIQFQKSSGGSVHHNTFARPNNNIVIIALSENDGLLRAHDGHVANNLIVYNWGNLSGADPFIGRGTADNPAKYTFGFENNAWYQLDAATAGLKMPNTSDPSKLLTNEPNAVYQVNPEFSVNLATVNLATLKPSDLVIRSTNPALANVGADAWNGDGGGDTTVPNVAPSLTAAAGNPVFTENGAAVTLYSGAAINLGEATDKVRTLVLTVAGLQNGGQETLVVDGGSVALTSGTTGITTATGINYSVAVASGTATMTLTMAGDMTVAQAQALVNGLKYQNASEDPLGSGRTVTLTLIRDSGGTANGGIDTKALNIASLATVRAVNDAPALTATAGSPNFTVGGAAVPLYSAAAIDLVEAADRVKTLVLTVSGLQDGGQEILVVDGQSVALTHGNTGTSSATGVSYGVAVSGGVATVTLSKTGDMTAAQAQTLVNGLSYQNTSANPLGSGRTVTLTSIRDSGGTANAGVDTRVLDIASAVTFKTVGEVVETAYLRTGLVSAGTSWTTVTLDHSYDSMVVVAAVTYTPGAPPLVARIRNAAGNRFELQVQRADTSTAAVSGVAVQYIVLEEGVYTQAKTGVKMEAVKYTSTVTDRAGSWVGQPQTYANAYTSPVVVGQVMTANDPGFSVFWARGTSLDTAPSSTALYVGKHVAQDITKTRVNEQIGYIVVEAGSGSLDGRPFEAGVGDATVRGVGNNLPITYALNNLTVPANAVVSSAGMFGSDGGWAVFSGPNSVTSNGLVLAIEEDMIGDTERNHMGERVAYWAFGNPTTSVGGNQAPSLTAVASNPTFTEAGPAATLYSGTAIDLVEAKDNVKTLVLTVSELRNGADEILVVDGTPVALTHGAAGTTSATGINYSVVVADGTATVTLTKPGDMTVAQAQTLVNGLQYRNTCADPLGSGRTVTLTLIQDCGGTANSGNDTQVLNVASAVTVTAVNNAPSVTVAAANPAFTENGPAVTLYSSAAIDLVEAADNVKTLVLTVTGLQNGAQEILVVDGKSVALTHGNTGTTTATGINYSVAVAAGTATVTLTKPGDITVAQAQTLVNGLQYQNTSEDPLGSGRTVTLTSIQDCHGTNHGGVDTLTLNIASAVTVRAVNDAPSLTAAAGNPTFTANGSAVTLYSGAAINAVEAADKVRTLVLTVSGLQNGSQEILVVDGTSVALTHGSAGTSSTTGINYSVAVTSGTATVTLTKAGDMTVAQAQTLVNGLQYRNASADPLGSGRTVTLKTIQDSGGTANGGIDTRVLSIASAVTIKKVDTVVESVFLRTGVVSASSSWMTVTLDRSYANMVVVATPTYQDGVVPVVTRIRNAQGNSFEVRVQRADKLTAAVSGVSVQYLVVEAGVYTLAKHGVKMEAVKYDSTVTDRRGSWVGQQRTYANAYASPVVVGQVMTANDAGFSVFWARGGSAGAAPSSTALSVGKHVGEDPKKTRANEVVGYIVIEAGGGAIGGRAFEAGVGANLVYGVDNKLPAIYPLTALTAPTNAVLSSAGMVGNDGGWAVLNGNTPVTAGGLNLAIDEDRLLDGERFHPAERVAYLAFDGAVSALLSLGEGEMAGASFDSMSAPESAESLSAAVPWGPSTVWNLDVTGDEHLTPGDVVVLINQLNASQLGEGLKGVLDVNRDGAVGALDVLTLINHLNTFGAQDLVSWELGTGGGAEGESPAAAPAAANDAALESEVHSTAWPIPMLDADDEEETETFWTPDQGTEPSGLESVLEEIAGEVDLSWSATAASA